MSTLALSAAALTLSLVQGPRPAYQLLPQEEDWAGFTADGMARPDFADGVKWMALDEGGSWRLTLGGSARARFEGWDAFGLREGSNPRSDDVFLIARVLLHADLRHRSGFRAFLQPKSAAAWDRDLAGGDRNGDQDVFDLQQGFIAQRFGLPENREFELRLGRQMLWYGRGRLIAPAPWGNALRSWDGALARYRDGAWVVDGFWVRNAPVQQSSFNDSVDDVLAGAYARRSDGVWTTELYGFRRTRDDVVLGAGAGRDRRSTYGVHLERAARAGEFDLDAEVALQSGSLGSEEIDAHLIGFELGYTFDSGPAPRLRAGLEVGSGDGGTATRTGTFETPFPQGHRHFGFLDAVGRSNSIDAYLGAGWPVWSSTDGGHSAALNLAVHRFWREDRDDFVYNADGVPYAGTAAVDGRAVGSEFDLVLSGVSGRHWSWELGWAHFVPDGALEQAGFDPDSDLIYASVGFAF